MIGKRSVAWIAIAALFGGCSDDDPAGPSDEALEVQIEGFPGHAHDEGRFELWISFAEAGLRHSSAASAGRFQIDSGGNVLADGGGPMTFAVDPASDLVPVLDDGSIAWQLAVDAFVTFEPPEDAAPESPNLPAIVGGAFLNGTAILQATYADALEDNFSSTAGSFHLATPTTTATSDETEGVWFALPGGASPSLVLPPAPSGWTYHAWLSLGFFGVVSLGGFTSASGPDFDGGGFADGQDADPYLFPGGDFPLGTSGVDIRGSTVLITLEPPADADGAGPSFLSILAASLDADQAEGVSVPLNNVVSFPEISVTVPLAR